MSEKVEFWMLVEFWHYSDHPIYKWPLFFTLVVFLSNLVLIRNDILVPNHRIGGFWGGSSTNDSLCGIYTCTYIIDFLII